MQNYKPGSVPQLTLKCLSFILATYPLKFLTKVRIGRAALNLQFTWYYNV